MLLLLQPQNRSVADRRPCDSQRGRFILSSCSLLPLGILLNHPCTPRHLLRALPYDDDQWIRRHFQDEKCSILVLPNRTDINSCDYQFLGCLWSWMGHCQTGMWLSCTISRSAGRINRWRLVCEYCSWCLHWKHTHRHSDRPLLLIQLEVLCWPQERPVVCTTLSIERSNVAQIKHLKKDTKWQPTISLLKSRRF